VVFKKVMGEGRASHDGSFTVSSKNYTSTYEGSFFQWSHHFKLSSRAGLQIFHTCNKKNCWEQEPLIEVPYEHVSTRVEKKKPFDLRRFELNAKFNDAKIDCVKM
ncbi:hypothetical protein PMAYCL1PPCAC_04856, partial [Pristionchus mayeri]